MISRGDTVRVSFWRNRANGRDFICAKIGTIELVSRDQAIVRFPGQHKPEQVALMNVEKINV